MKKAVIIAIMCVLLTGCDRKSETIKLLGRTDWSSNDSLITLKNGWFSCGFSIDYEKGQVVIQIEEVMK